MQQRPRTSWLATIFASASLVAFASGCAATPVPEPGENEKKNYRAQIAEPPTPRKIVFLFDYYTIPKPDRAMVLGFARYMLQQGRTPDEEVMIVALANGVRIEQRFTTDPRKLDSTLQRMEHDVTLYARDFLGVSGRPYFDNLARVMDVLAEYDGAKGVVMFSQWMGASDTHDLWFQEVTARAASARARIYPVLTAGLQVGVSAGGPAGLARFANETGGETTFRTNDLSLGYARAQRDMACSYGIGFYIGKDEPRKPRRVTVRLAEPGGRRVRGPEQVGLFDEKEQVENSLRAAMVDPGNFLNPYIRGHVVPIRPSSKSGWSTWIALHFRMKVSPGGNDLDVVATIKDEDHVQIKKFREQFKIRPTTDGSPQPVTIQGDMNLKPGSYTLTMAVNQVGNAVPQTTVVDLIIPEVPEGLILRGPVLAKALQEGMLIRTKKPDADAEKTLAVLQSIIGDDGSFQPLLIHQIDTDDTLLAYWEACSFDKKPPEGATVRSAAEEALP